MDEEAKQKPKRGCGWMQVCIGLLCALLVVGAIKVTFRVLADKANRDAMIGNCRVIVTALRLYADDHDGTYPDAHASEPATSNDAFRILFVEGIVDHERNFGAKMSKYEPDENTGDPPAYEEALKAGENHWAMTKGLTTKSIPRAPLIFENPVAAGWPPMWNVDAAGKKEKGRAWRGGKIVVGFNDGSAEVIQLESAKGSQVGPKSGADGKNMFTRVGDPMDMLDVLE